MRHLLATCLTVGVALSAAGEASANVEALDRVTNTAQTVRQEAEGVRRLLDGRKTDFQAVTQRVALLETHAQALKDAMAAASAGDVMASRNHASWAQAQAATDALLALLANKSRMLADSDRAERDRGLLRAKADAIAKRAAMVEQHVSRVRG